MKCQDFVVQAEDVREKETQKSEDDVWAEELSKIDEASNPFLPERTIVATPHGK